MATKKSASSKVKRTSPVMKKRAAKPRSAAPRRTEPKCVVCGQPAAPFSEESLCWVCRRLKISAWRDTDSQAAMQE